MGGLFRLLLLVGFVVKFWWLIPLLSAIAICYFGIEQQTRRSRKK